MGRSCQLWEDLGGCGASSLQWAGAQEVGNECVGDGHGGGVHREVRSGVR